MEPTREDLFRLVTSDAGRRLAEAKAEYGVAFPPLSSDPWQQWLVEEALMAAYTARQRAREREAQAHEDAREEAAELIRRHKEQGGR